MLRRYSSNHPDVLEMVTILLGILIRIPPYSFNFLFHGLKLVFLGLVDIVSTAALLTNTISCVR